MKRVIIVAPHFPPSNLASVHRTRLFVRHLPEFGWEPIVVTVGHEHYEERLDRNLAKLVPSELRVEEVGAFPVKPFRIVGDIGVRGFLPMLRRILKLIDEEGADFLYIPIPPFFAAPLGRIVHALRGIPYGIDYIDPWVHDWPEAKQVFTKHWVSRHLADLLEPVAVRKAALITGVAEGYYEDMFERNPHLRETVVVAAMPYGGERADHRKVSELDLQPYLFTREPGVFQFLYAGAMLPKAFGPLERIFSSLAHSPALAQRVRFHFVGTGTSPDDPEGYNVRPLAERYGLWGSVVKEHPPRIPYLDVLAHLDAVDGVFILGSTEPHYTPSKVYQGVLSERPIFAVLHQASTACAVIQETGAGQVIAFNGPNDQDRIEAEFAPSLQAFLTFAASFDPSQVNQEAFDAYSARSVTRTLAEALDRSVGHSKATS